MQKHLSSQPYSPKIAVQLQQDVDQFRDQSAIENDVGAMEVNLGRARSAVDGKRLTAVDLGDMEMLGEATSEGAEMGFYTAEEAGVLFWEGQQRIFSKRREGVVAESPQEVLKYAEDPEAKEMPAEFAGLGQAAWRELKVKARESMYRHQRGLMEDFREAVRSNMVRDDADAEVWAEMHVPEGMRDATLRPLMHQVLHGEGVDLAEVNRIRAAIGAHDPKGPDAKGREERMRLLHMQFPAEVQEELDGVLDARVKSGRPESMVMQAGRRYLQDLHEREMYVDTEGRRLTYRRTSPERGGAGDAKAFDADVRNQSAQRMSALGLEMEDHLAKNPETTPKQVRQWIGDRVDDLDAPRDGGSGGLPTPTPIPSPQGGAGGIPTPTPPQTSTPMLDKTGWEAQRVQRDAEVGSFRSQPGMAGLGDAIGALDRDHDKMVEHFRPGLEAGDEKSVAAVQDFTREYIGRRQMAMMQADQRKAEIAAAFLELDQNYREGRARAYAMAEEEREEGIPGEGNVAEWVEVWDEGHAAAVRKVSEKYGLTPEQAEVLKRDADATMNWSAPMFQEGDKARVLSDGRVVVNPRLWADPDGYKAAVEAMNATPEAKKLALGILPELRKKAATDLINSLQTIRDVPAVKEWFDAHPGTVEEQAAALIKEQKGDGIAQAINRVNGGGAGIANQGIGVLAALTGFIRDKTGVSLGDDYLHQSMQYWHERSGAWERLAELGDTGMLVNGATKVLGGATSMLPAMAGGRAVTMLAGRYLGAGKALQAVGMGSTSGIAAGQSGGDTYSDAYAASLQRGLPEMEARRQSLKPAVVSALITGVLTKAGGPNGVESVFRSEAGRALVKKTLWERAKAVGIDMGEEALEEGTDTLLQGINARFSYNPDKPLEEILGEAFEAAWIGGVLGGSVSGVRQGAEMIRETNTVATDGRSTSENGTASSKTQASPISESAVDSRTRDVFGPDTKLDKYNLPVPPRTLPEGDALLQPTKDKKSAILEPDHILVQSGKLAAGIEIPREQFQNAVLHYFLSQARPVAVGQQPTVIAAGGGGGSGKSSVLMQMETEGKLDADGAVTVNPDDIAPLLPEFSQIKAAGDSRAAATVHSEASHLSGLLMDALLSLPPNQRPHIIYDSTLAWKDHALAQFKRWHENGYQINLIGVTVDPKEAMVRAAIRAKQSGRWVPHEILAEAHAGFNSSVADYLQYVDSARLVDNTGSSLEVIATKDPSTKQIHIVNQQLWDTLTSRGKKP